MSSVPAPARRAALITAVALTGMAVVAIQPGIVVAPGVVVPGDPAATAANVAADLEGFRIVVLRHVAVVVLDVVVAWSLYELLRPVNRGLSLLAAWFRLGYSLAYWVAVAHLLRVPGLLDPTRTGLTGTDMELHVHAALEAFSVGWASSFVLFGIHLLLVGALAFKADYMPKILGLLVAVCGLGWLADAFGAFLLPETWHPVFVFTSLGELLLIPWGFWIAKRDGLRG